MDRLLSSIEILQFADRTAASDFVSVIQVIPDAGGAALTNGGVSNDLFIVNVVIPIESEETNELIQNGGFGKSL